MLGGINLVRTQFFGLFCPHLPLYNNKVFDYGLTPLLRAYYINAPLLDLQLYLYWTHQIKFLLCDLNLFEIPFLS